MTSKRPSPENMTPDRLLKLVDNKTRRRWYGHAVLAYVAPDILPEFQETAPDRLLLDLSVSKKDALELSRTGYWASIKVFSKHLNKIDDTLAYINNHAKGRGASFVADPRFSDLLLGTLLVKDNDSQNQNMLETFAYQVRTLVDGDNSREPLCSIGNSMQAPNSLPLA